MIRLTSFLNASVMLTGWVLSCESSVAVAPDPSLDAVLKASQRLVRKPLDEREDETSLSWDYALSKNDTPTAVMGVVSLWKKNRRSLVELVWWRHHDPVVRKAVLLLFYGLTKIEADNFPSFNDYAARFEAAESASRKNEIEEVKTALVKNREVLDGAFPRNSR